MNGGAVVAPLAVLVLQNLWIASIAIGSFAVSSAMSSCSFEDPARRAAEVAADDARITTHWSRARNNRYRCLGTLHKLAYPSRRERLLRHGGRCECENTIIHRRRFHSSVHSRPTPIQRRSSRSSYSEVPYSTANTRRLEDDTISNAKVRDIA